MARLDSDEPARATRHLRLAAAPHELEFRFEAELPGPTRTPFAPAAFSGSTGTTQSSLLRLQRPLERSTVRGHSRRAQA